MSNLPFQIPCPNKCVGYHPWHYNIYYKLNPIFIKHPDTGELIIATLKCPKCKFEAWSSKELRDRFGKPTQPYWDGKKIVIEESSKEIDAVELVRRRREERVNKQLRILRKEEEG